jgi:hypothetical protein
MNERINELIKQSYVTVQSPSGEGYTHFSQEKFAELIVRECANISNQAEQQCQHPATQILKHFGVEE